MFGLCFDLTRKVRGQTFRKRLGVDYKTAVQHTQKSPHAIPLNQKQQLLTSKPGGNWKAIRELLRDSPRPFGRFQGRRNNEVTQNSSLMRQKYQSWTSQTWRALSWSLMLLSKHPKSIRKQYRGPICNWTKRITDVFTMRAQLRNLL